MNYETIPLWLALVTQVGLGLAVFRANYKSYANQSFLLVSIFISAWLLSLQFAFNANRVADAEFWIRNASASGILIVNGFNLLRLAILCRESGWRAIGKRSIPLAIPSLIVIGACYTHAFLERAELLRDEAPPHELVPQPIYGPLLPFFVAFLCAVAVLTICLYIRDARRAAGMAKVELQFVLAGGVAMAILTLALGLVLQPFLQRAVVVRLAPFRVVVFSVIIAYGIATRKIMDVGTFVRRLVSYSLLTAYLTAIYIGTWWTTNYFLHGFSEAALLSQLIATLAVALSMTPARGVSKNFADKLFINSSGLDFRATVSKAAGILASVTTLSDLLHRFAATIMEAVGTDRLVILLHDRNVFAQKYAGGTSKPDEKPLVLEENDPLLHYLRTYRGPLVRDELHRVHQTAEIAAVLQRMRQLELAAAMGIFAREHLAAVMLLGPRLSGRIYGSVEQNALQVLCGQLAVAIENAQLFTEVQNAKIYNETLLENLTTGVIAAGADEKITVFNNEAGQITELNPREIIDHPMDELPEGLRDMLRETLRTGDRQENSELTVRSGDRSVVVRASSSIFHGQNHEMLGALVVLTDITDLKRLELQIRRSDRLASLGTLSAGMAHEIKNPLVSIKTFAQLLPERYQDSDFRETFSNLIGHEIDRIDTLVNQLLRFARPAKPVLRPVHVHDVLEKSLQLVGHRLYQKEIKLTRSWQADVDTIRADADQLEQVFLNFFLNAMEALKRGGEMTVSTEIRPEDEWVAAISGANGDVHEVLRITIRDNGEGIRSEDIPHVFDPFFTTKDYGTGLGLSVVHGIIQEHGGQIEVESELALGTAFHILLPLVRFPQEVAAA
jgi:PAS domain S-box-containing protein